MSLCRSAFLCSLISCSAVADATASAQPPADNVADRVFTALIGPWDGLAVETPVGPVDYAITFHDCDIGVTAGVAELNVSDHYWRFWQTDGELRLTFLSTFRGNQEPTQLVVSRTEDNTIWFHAPALSLLTLSVTLNEPDVDIRIFHHHEPHVYIRLQRPGGPMPVAGPAGNKEKSCSTL